MLLIDTRCNSKDRFLSSSLRKVLNARPGAGGGGTLAWGGAEEKETSKKTLEMNLVVLITN